MRNDYELPSIDTLTRLTSKVRNLGDDSFLKNVYLNMDERQKSCFLLIDEVYVKPMLQYHNIETYGNIETCGKVNAISYSICKEN